MRALDCDACNWRLQPARLQAAGLWRVHISGQLGAPYS